MSDTNNTPEAVNETPPAQVDPASMTPAERQHEADKLLYGECVSYSKAHSVIPQAYHNNPQALYAVAKMGQRLGLDILASANGIANVRGKPTIHSATKLAVCRMSGEFAGQREFWSGEGDQLTAHCEVFRKGEEFPYAWQFSVEDAKMAGLWGKAGPWAQFPKRMLMSRARKAYDDAFPDLLMGVYSVEEMEGARMDYRHANAPEAPSKPAMPSAADLISQDDLPGQTTLADEISEGDE